jgi:hypothetical protein
MSVTSPQESGINQTQVLNLKQAQQERHDITILKNHEKKWLRVRPSQQPQSYGDNSVIEFNLKGQGVDYVNLNGSVLVVTMQWDGAGTTVPAKTFFTYGTMGMFKRFQLRSGVFDVEDINQWGKFMYYQTIFPAKKGFVDFLSRIAVKDPPEFALVKNQSNTFQVPFATCLDNGGYFPVYNLAEELKLRFTLDNGNNALSVLGDDCTYTFRIDDAYLLVDGLTATSGSVLNDVPYKFKSFTTLGFVNSVVGVADVRIDKFSYDVKKTSLKKFFGGYNINIVPNDKTSSPDVYRSLFIENVNKYFFSMGGINYPFQDGVVANVQQWTQFQKYFHRQDVSLILEHWQTGFKEFTSTKPGEYPESGAITASFDRLDQMSSVISGIDSERYPVQLIVDRKAVVDGIDTPASFYAWFTFDIIITLIGGEIKKED